MSLKTLLAASTALSLTAGFALAYSTETTSGATEEPVELTAETQGDIADIADGDMETANEVADAATNNNAAMTSEEVSEIAENDGAEGGMSPETGLETTMAEAMTTDPLPASPFVGMTVGELVGMNVEGAEGEAVGEIDYVITRNGEMKAVIGVGGLLGLGEYTVALPLSAFDMTGETLSIEETEASLRDMPQIDESEIDGLSDDTPLS